MFGEDGTAGRSALEDSLPCEGAYGNGSQRPVRPLRGFYGWVCLSDHVRGQRLEVDAAVRNEEEVGNGHHVYYLQNFLVDMNDMGQFISYTTPTTATLPGSAVSRRAMLR